MVVLKKTSAFRAGNLFELWANVLEYPESG